ncbi:UDP-D-xylose:L-fucose alpha-1 [Forsythia ovata]|uniref:UDP-D-xylose:L-fucose alpha-1 n=1 Tax=Forsythia ovata TaxID=205694 RepID=A0ABD1QS40_9LAMI
MSSLRHQRPVQNVLSAPYPSRFPQNYQKPTTNFLTRTNLILLFTLLIILGVLIPWIQVPEGFLMFNSNPNSKWRDYTLSDAAARVAKNNTLIVCAVTLPRQKQHEKVLVIAEDYATLYKVNERWPGHAILVPPVLEAAAAHKFGSQGFFNFTARRPRHLLKILELGYNVMYNDVDMVWLANPFPYLQGEHDVYFMDDMAFVKPLNHSHSLPPPGKKGRPYICSCMIYMRPTNGCKISYEEMD